MWRVHVACTHISQHASPLHQQDDSPSPLRSDRQHFTPSLVRKCRMMHHQRKLCMHACMQGVIGDTFHASASTAGVIDDPLRPAPLSASQAVYPVYPDFAYEIPDYFSAPRYTIPSTVTQAVISARRAPSSTSTNALTTSPSILS